MPKIIALSNQPLKSQFIFKKVIIYYSFPKIWGEVLCLINKFLSYTAEVGHSRIIMSCSGSNNLYDDDDVVEIEEFFQEKNTFFLSDLEQGM